MTNFAPSTDDILAAKDATIIITNASIASAATVLLVNTAIGAAADKATTGAQTQAEYNNVLEQVLEVLITNGTSSKATYAGAFITVKTAAATDAAGRSKALPFSGFAAAIKQYTTIRRYASYYAPLAKRICLEKQIDQALLNKHGIPIAYKHLAFDFANALPDLSIDEQAVLDAAKRVALYRSSSSQLYNTSVEYTHGVMGSGSRPALMQGSRPAVMNG